MDIQVPTDFSNQLDRFQISIVAHTHYQLCSISDTCMYIPCIVYSQIPCAARVCFQLLDIVQARSCSIVQYVCWYSHTLCVFIIGSMNTYAKYYPIQPTHRLSVLLLWKGPFNRGRPILVQLFSQPACAKMSMCTFKRSDRHYGAFAVCFSCIFYIHMAIGVHN